VGSYTDKKILSPLTGIKPPFLSQPKQTQDKCKHSTILLHHNHTRFYLTSVSELVSSHYIKTSSTFKNSSFKDYKILKNNKIFPFILITNANTNRLKQVAKQNLFPDSSRNCNIEIKRNEYVTEEMERNLQSQFQLQTSGKINPGRQ
jgi:hypothetical protein